MPVIVRILRIRCWFINHIKIYECASHNYKSIFIASRVIFFEVTLYFTFFGDIPNGLQFGSSTAVKTGTPPTKLM